MNLCFQYAGRKFCGLSKPRDFVSISTNVTFKFVSDDKFYGNPGFPANIPLLGGFAAQWNTEGEPNTFPLYART